MAEEPRDENPKPKTSAELIAEARNAFGTDSPSGEEASEDLMDRARGWLKDNAATEPEPIVTPTLAMEPEVDEEIGRLFKPPPARPVGRRPRVTTQSIPAPIPDSERPTRQRRRVLGLAAAIGVIALLSNVTALLINSESDDTFVSEPTVTESEGSITSALDPCSGATISGDLLAVFSYRDDADTAFLDADITGNALVGSDGSTYFLRIFGTTTGDRDQNEFTFESEYMEMIREDGSAISNTATFTVEIEDRNATTWSASWDVADCEA